jgi:hypothetical protein
MEEYLPWLAIILSVLSLYISAYRIYRDRSKLYVFSEVVFDCSSDQSADQTNPPPFLRVLAVNKGARPIILTDFGGQVNKKSATWWSLKNDLVLDDKNCKPLLFSSGLAQNIGVKIEDGDVYELRIKHDDYTKIYSINHDFLEFNKLFFRDVLGKKYFVKNSPKGIKQLLQYREK